MAAQVIGETFLFGAAACLLALAAAGFLRGKALIFAHHLVSMETLPHP
jgi:hypothetical protein